jgi:hypothetical protein
MPVVTCSEPTAISLDGVHFDISPEGHKVSCFISAEDLREAFDIPNTNSALSDADLRELFICGRYKGDIPHAVHYRYQIDGAANL